MSSYNFGSKYRDIFKSLAKFIAIIDFIKSNAKTATLYNYCKPNIIDNKNNGFIDTKKMRHPIGEYLEIRLNIYLTT